MAPAHTKITNKDGHGVHLSSPLSNNLDSDGGAVLRVETEPLMKRTEDGYSQKMDSCLSKSTSEVPLLPPMLATSAAQYKAVLLPSPASILSLLSIHKSLKDSPPRVAPGLPGAADMYLLPVPEHNRQEARMQPGHSGAPGCGPDGRDYVPQAPAPLPPPLFHWEEKAQPRYHPTFLTHPVTVTQEEEKEEVVDSHHPLALAQPWGVGSNSNRTRPASDAALLEEATVRELTRWQLSRQAGLQSWAGRLQRRLQALQGRHAVLHCGQQLEGLEKALLQTRGISSSTSSNTQDVTKQWWKKCPTGRGARPSPPVPSTELEEFGCSGRAVLRELQEALDSEATASSSSDEESDLESRRRGSKPWPTSRRRSNSHSGAPVPGSSERRWQEDRAEVGSRWSWLQLRVAELEGRIQQLEELHKHICSTKGGVVLAKSQPLTDRQIQQTLLRETAGLSYTTGAGELPADSDSEPSSPTRLLHNIQRQSAQLSQIVTSLSPFSSPNISKQPQAWKGHSKRAFSSGLGGYELLSLAAGSKRRKVVSRGKQQLLKADASRVCARTRPLVTYHKPNLFTLHLHGTSSSSPKRVERSPSSSSTSTCPTCSSCDPVALCADPTCTSSSPLTSSTAPSRPHPVLSLSSDTPLSHHLQTALAREEWLQRPLVVKAERSSPGGHCYYNTSGCDSSTLLHNNQSHRHHVRHGKGGVRGPSPVRWAGTVQTPNSRANQRRRKKGHTHTVTEDEEDFLSQLSDPEDSSEDTWSPQISHTRKQSTPAPVRRRQADSVYDIHNLAFPMALVSKSKVEKMEYKNILTRGWRVVECQSPGDKPEEEAVTDEAFHQRHFASEQREKQGWSALSMNPSYKQPSRSGSRWSAGVEGVCSSWSEDGTVDPQMDTEEQPGGAEEWLPPLSPWEPRVFPLAGDEEKALFSEEEEEEEAAAPQCCSAKRPRTTRPTSSTAVLASKSQYSSPALSTTSTTTPPSGGQRRNCPPNGRIACRSSPG